MMSQTIDVATDKTQQLKTKILTSRVVAFLFTGGMTGSIVWTVNEPTSLVAAGGIFVSAAGAIAYGVKAGVMHERYSCQRRLHARQRQTATKINKFPSESDFMLELANIRNNDSGLWPLRKTSDEDELQKKHMMRLYQTLERVNARAAVMFVETSSKIDGVKFREDTYGIESDFNRIDEILGRVHEGYHYLLKAYPYKKLFDFSSAGLDQAVKQVTLTGMVKSVKKLAHELQDYGDITMADYDRIYETTSRLEPLLRFMPGRPSVRRRAVLDFELIELELEAYASSYTLQRHHLEASFILNNRPV